MHNTLVRILAVALLALTSMLPACACGAGGGAGGGGIVCTGGARMVGAGCFCPTGTTFDGTQCQGQAQQGSCPAGELEVVGQTGAACFCPDGQVWADANRTGCAACTGGSIASGDSCVCPDGTAWDGNQNQCVQQQVVAQEQPQQPQCQGGAILTDNGCACPDGTQWDGNQCSPVQQQQTVIQQQNIQQNANISLTCCINHTQYECPSQKAFNDCVTLSPHHCKHVGGC